MNAVKNKVFNDLANPMAFTTTSGFEERNVTHVNAYGSGMYFYGVQGEWFVNTPPVKVLASSVNEFRDGEHVLKIACDDAWAATMTEKLKEAVRLAHPSMQQAAIDFEQVWRQCDTPNFQTLEIRSKYKAKRSKTFDYVNMYNNKEEITGRYTLCAGSTVQCSLRFVLSEKRLEDADAVQTGIYCDFGAGIRVLKLGQEPKPIQRPWDWSKVDFDTLSVPMYDTVRVKTGSVSVTSVDGLVATVEPKPELDAALRDFHERADAEPWNREITVRKPIEPGCVAVATVVPIRHKRHITWTAATLHTARRKRPRLAAPNGQATAVAKTDDDNTDNSSGKQTTD